MAIGWATAADAGEPPPSFDIPAGSITVAIAEAAREAQVSIGTQGALPNLTTPRVRGRMSIDKVLARLLARTGYIARQVGPTAWRIERAAPNVPPTPPPQPKTPEAISERIVITGTKRALRLDELPMAVVAVTPESSETVDPSLDAVRVAARSEGLAITALGPGRNRLFVRGVADSAFSGESQSTVAIVLDDSRLTYAAPDPDLRLVDVKRVEVLKGPQGSLYGTGALGGIYHIVTNQPDLAVASLKVASGADLIAGSIGRSASLIANLPLVPGRAALRIVGYAANEPGWVDTGPRADANATEVIGGRAAFTLATGGWRFDVTGLGQFLSSRDSSYVYLPGARSRPGQSPEPHDNDLSHVALRAEHMGGSVDLVLNSGATWHEVDDMLDATTGATGLGLADPKQMEDDRHFELYDAEMRASGVVLGKVTWVAGLAYLVATQRERQVLSGEAGANLVLNDERRTSRDGALFADATLPLTSQLSLDAGGRVSTDTIEESRHMPAGMVEQGSTRTAFTPSAALAWRARDGGLFYLRYGSAFRQGGIAVSPSGELRKLLGDELATIEVGWKENTPGGGTLDLTAWYSWWENVQSDGLGPGGLVDTVNAGDARISGVEGTWKQPIGRGLYFELGGNVTSANLTSNALGIRLDDLRLPVVPEYAARGGIETKVPVGGALVTLSANVRYDGPARLSFDPTIDRPMGNVFDVELGARTMVRGWALSARVENLLNGARDTFAYGNPFRVRTFDEYTPQRPRTLRLSVARRIL